MDDNTYPSTRLLPLVVGFAVAAALVFAGMYLARAVDAGASSADDMISSDTESLHEENSRLAAELGRARAEIASLRRDVLQPRRQPIIAVPASEPSKSGEEEQSRDAVALRSAIDEALRAGNGQQLLHLLDELDLLGEVNYPTVAAHWIRLANMGAAALDRLGLSKIDLASALVRSEAVMKFALEEADLDPMFRQFAARTLEQASTKSRRAILDSLDFATEKDRAVLFALVRATDGFRDEIYVDRFHQLVKRTDLYNDGRSSIAFRIAEIGGDKARAAIDELRRSSRGKGLFRRMLPVLESIYSPPATGLLVTNGMRPSSNRIGHNDLILEYGGHRIRSRADLTRADAKSKRGQIVSVKILRSGVEHILLITVTDTAPGHLHFSSMPIVKN